MKKISSVIIVLLIAFYLTACANELPKIKVISEDDTLEPIVSVENNAEHRILASYSSINDLFGLKLYRCSNSDPLSERATLNYITDDETIATIRYIGKENIYLEICNEENTWICSVPYIEGD